MPTNETDSRWMARAMQLAAQGLGYVEPNPMVGCVIVRDGEMVGQGWHRRFGMPHAEVEALREAGDAARRATMYVTLEPCCHHGKTPPCTQAIIEAEIERVVIAQGDPFEKVSGAGIRQLTEAGIRVESGLLEAEAHWLNAPYVKLVRTGKPWVLAKWASSLDGKLASHSGDSRWISNEASRSVVHQIRGRVDGIMIGRRTAEVDDPLLTARPPGARVATRIVLDSHAKLSVSSQLVRTAQEVPVLVVAGTEAPPAKLGQLTDHGCEVLVCDGSSREDRMDQLLVELGGRRMTNLLVEGGGELLGHLFDHRVVDEVHVFIAPKIVGGRTASVIGGRGVQRITNSLLLQSPSIEQLEGDIYIHGRVDARPSAS